MTVLNLLSEFHRRYVHQIVHNGIYRQACGAVYLQLTRDVAPVGYHGVDRNTKMVGNLFIGHSLHQAHYNVFLAVAQRLAVIRITAYHFRNLHAHVVLLKLAFKVAYGRYEYAVFHHRMVLQPLFVVIQVI